MKRFKKEDLTRSTCPTTNGSDLAKWEREKARVASAAASTSVAFYSEVRMLKKQFRRMEDEVEKHMSRAAEAIAALGRVSRWPQAQAIKYEVEKEREECAKLLDQKSREGMENSNSEEQAIYSEAAAAIRARGKA